MTVGLIYHDVAAPSEQESVGFPGSLAGRYRLTPDHFEVHLAAIDAQARGVGLVLPGARRPQVALTFDDGGSSAMSIAGMLERHGWRGHFFVTTGCIDRTGFLTTAGVRELSECGHEVGSHAHTHPTYMGKLGRDELRREWSLSREVLGEVLGRPPATAAVPGGFVSPIVIEEAARAGYRVLVTSEPLRRERRHGDMTVMGRYTIWASTPARTAAAYARGSLTAGGRLWLEWNTKGVAKRISPRAYDALRRLRAEV
jgi:peptidoglycan/xylan/chitin deacetylase (PgdA/CDA1 family)